ncbi:hypothetical protein IWW38_003658, partial [Coemansia aciculifera]
MWLRHKLSEQSRSFSNSQNQAAGEWQDIPKNPVFYPPTPKKELETAPAEKPSPAANDPSRPSRLISRLKTIFVPKSSALSSDSQAATKHNLEWLGSGSQHSLRRQTSKLGTFRKSKLVARSPVREDSISPDLRALADSDRIPSPTKGGEYSFPLDGMYSPAAFFAQVDQRSPRRMHTITMAYSPPQEGARTGCSYTRSPDRSFSRSPSRCSPDSAANRDNEYCTFMYAPRPNSPSPCPQSFFRSLSMDMPSFQPTLLRQQQPNISLNDSSHGCRSSQASESTVVAALDTLSQLDEIDSQVSSGLMPSES